MLVLTTSKSWSDSPEPGRRLGTWRVGSVSNIYHRVRRQSISPICGVFFVHPAQAAVLGTARPRTTTPSMHRGREPAGEPSSRLRARAGPRAEGQGEKTQAGPSSGPLPVPCPPV